MNPAKVNRAKLNGLTDLPNIGAAMQRDLTLLGYRTPADLVGVDPLTLYHALCAASGQRQDPCVLDTFMSVTDFLGGARARPWWEYTAERKRRYAI